MGMVSLMLLTLSAVVGAQAPASGCSVAGQIEIHPDGWTAIRAPEFGRGAASLAAYAVDPFESSRLYVTNGTVIKRSTDGGCTWGDVSPASPLERELPFVTTGAIIEAIVVPHTPAVSDRVYAVWRMTVKGDAGPSASGFRTRVVRSLDAGNTWDETSADEAVNLVGAPVRLAVSESDPAALYLATTVPAGAVRATLTYSSTDAGVRWEAHIPTEDSDERSVEELSDVAIDPVDPGSLWGVGPAGVWRSTRGGRTWEKVPDVSSAMNLIDVYRVGGGAPRVWAFGDDSVRSDDGSTWTQMQIVGGESSVTHGVTPDQVFTTAAFQSAGAAYGFRPEQGDWVLLKSLGEPLFGASRDGMAIPRFYAHSPYRIWRFAPTGTTFEPPPSAGPGEPGGPGGGGSPPPSAAGCAAGGGYQFPHHKSVPGLEPAGATIVLNPGESQTVPYTLVVPGSPSPVDLYFLIDTSDSMQPAICGVARGSSEIASRLLEAGVNAWFGIGSYQHMPSPEEHGGPIGSPENLTCYSYRRDRVVAPLSGAFTDALNKMKTCGGTEPQMTSLVQSVTGEGLQPWIQPGQNANWRAGAIRVIVHIGNEPLNHGGLHNSHEDVVATLVENDVLQVGVSIGGESAGWLRRVAEDTGTVAVEPVDCDGDGWIEVDPGEPLMCVATASNVNSVPLAGAVAKMILALEDQATVRLIPTKDAGKVVDDIAPPSYDVDFRKASEFSFDFDVTYACDVDQAGEIHPVTLGGKVRSKVVVSVPATVVCLDELPPVIPPVPPVGLGVAPPPPVPPPPAPLPAPAPAPAPAPGTAPAPAPAPAAQPQPIPQANAQPQPNPQAQANPQAQTQAQAGLATQKQEQAQTALAKAAEKVAEQEEYSMTARSRREPSRLPLAAGGAIALGYGCVALAVRRRTQRAEARWR